MPKARWGQSMTREDAKQYVSYLVDDALAEHPLEDMLPNARLVGWQCGFEPLFVAVQSYLPKTTVDESDAMEIALDFLVEKKWFSGEPSDPDYCL
jgi:hypothetical protein